MSDFRSDLPVRVVQEAGDPPVKVEIISKRSVGEISEEYDISRNHLDSARSFNNRLVVETYQKQGLQSKVSNGFAFVEQKVTVKGLTVLVDAKLADGTYVPRGSIAYIKEESLHTQPWAQKIYECDFIKGQFIVVDMTFVDFIAPPPSDAA